jgi:hypothetical protein
MTQTNISSIIKITRNLHCYSHFKIHLINREFFVNHKSKIFSNSKIYHTYLQMNFKEWLEKDEEVFLEFKAPIGLVIKGLAGMGLRALDSFVSGLGTAIISGLRRAYQVFRYGGEAEHPSFDADRAVNILGDIRNKIIAYDKENPHKRHGEDTYKALQVIDDAMGKLQKGTSSHFYRTRERAPMF